MGTERPGGGATSQGYSGGDVIIKTSGTSLHIKQYPWKDYRMHPQVSLSISATTEKAPPLLFIFFSLRRMHH